MSFVIISEVHTTQVLILSSREDLFIEAIEGKNTGYNTVLYNMIIHKKGKHSSHIWYLTNKPCIFSILLYTTESGRNTKPLVIQPSFNPIPIKGKYVYPGIWLAHGS